MERYYKNELIGDIASTASGFSKKDIETILKLAADFIVEALKDGKKVTFSNFGNFEIKMRSERKGRNPSNGEEIIIPAKKVLSFHASKNFSI